MMNIVVSLIVPIYNVEKYIVKCVESLRNQDYPNIEIILVDDGSTDNSTTIIDELAKKDDRIIVIHQKNQGVSIARNTGIEVSHGDYIMFVDGDDWVDVNYVSYFLSLVEQSGCELGMNRNNYSAGSTVSNENRYTIDAEKTIEWIYLGKIFVAVWNKIYKRSMLTSSNVRFNPEIWYGEGMLFNIECLQYVDKVAIGEKAVYHQTFNPDSAMRKFNLKSNLCGIHSLEIQKQVWKKKTPAIENAWNYHRYCFNRSIVEGLVRTDLVKDNKELFDECVNNIRKGILIPLRTDKHIRRIVGWMGYFICPMFMAKRSAYKFKKQANAEKN